MTSISLKITRNLCRWRSSLREGGRLRNHGGCEYLRVARVFILLTLTSPRDELASCLPTDLLCLRFEIDLSRLPINERQLYNHGLDPGKGRLVCLVTLRPCWGVSISDIETAPLEKPDERDSVEEKFVRCLSIPSCQLILLLLQL